MEQSANSQKAICPFNPLHRIDSKKLKNHILTVCSEYQKQKDRYDICPYNAEHRILKNDPDSHY